MSDELLDGIEFPSYEDLDAYDAAQASTKKEGEGILLEEEHMEEGEAKDIDPAIVDVARAMEVDEIVREPIRDI